MLRPDLVLHLVALYSALERDHVVLLPLLLAAVAMYRQPRWTGDCAMRAEKKSFLPKGGSRK